jgi:hypothetical protein
MTVPILHVRPPGLIVGRLCINPDAAAGSSKFGGGDRDNGLRSSERREEK